MAYVSLYRKWRPQTFADVVGQTHAVQTIKNALDHGRLSHAYLFCGPRGTGKTTVARLIAKGLNCAEGPTSSPCNECPSCEKITKGLSMDVIEIDAASNRGIDEIRDLREKVRFAPTEGQYKVYIIDEVHMLTTDAFNALLKTLEEPPSHVVFVLATTEPHKIPGTILSRCQRYDFRSLTPVEIADRLKYVSAQEEIPVTPDAVDLIAKHAAGGMRDALGLLDQCSAFSSDEITGDVAADALGVAPQEQLLAFAKAIGEGKSSDCIQMLQEVVFQGKDLRQFAKDTADIFRNIMLCKVNPNEANTLSNGEVSELCQSFSVPRLLQLLEGFGRLDNDIRLAADERVPFELAIIRLASGPSAPASSQVATDDVQRLRDEIKQLAAKVAELQSQLAVHGSVSTPASSQKFGSESADAPNASTNPASNTLANTPGPDNAGDDVDDQGKDHPREEPGLEQTGEGILGSIAQVESVWEEVFEVLRQERQASLGAFLREAVPAAVSGDRLVLAFPQDRGFHKASVEQPKMREQVERVLARLTGVKFLVQCEFGSKDEVANRFGSAGSNQGTIAAPQAPSGMTEDSETDDPVPAEISAETPVVTIPEAEAGSGESSDVQAGQSPQGENAPIVKAALEIFGGKLIKLK